MSQDTISEATDYMYFNLDRKYFQTIEYKNYIQELFNKYWFKGSFKSKDITCESDIYNISLLIKEIKCNTNLFNRLFHYPLKRTGNAEVMLFLLINNSYLSNNNTSGRDIVINDEFYEIKNCRVGTKYKSEDLFYSNFKLGNSFSIREILNSIEMYFGYLPKGSEINKAREDIEFQKIEDNYRNIVYDNYFSKNNIILIDSNGLIHFVGKVKKEDIYIDSITEGTIKPMIKVGEKNGL